VNGEFVNPATNRLGGGVTEQQVMDAVLRSGYPVQTTVASALGSACSGREEGFRIQEEWCFVDSDTKELRNLDLRADLTLHGWAPQPRVRPNLTLLIECKRSDLPYVFFESVGHSGWINCPPVAGLRSAELVITSDDDPSSWTFDVCYSLDLQQHPFCRPLSVCRTFSKCVRKGNELEMSGSDPYNSLVLPLTKSLSHAISSRVPVETAWYFDADLVNAVAVLDAPMLVANQENGNSTMKACPWVRLLRHEYRVGADRTHRNEQWAIDVVHKDYFVDYLNNNLMPFSALFAERVLRHPEELATGRAFASGMGADSWRGIESRLRPANIASAGKRVAAIARRRKKLPS
jgi:hypothetical protein